MRIEQLNMRKVDDLGGIYNQVHVGIARHPVFIDATEVSEVNELDFGFIYVDGATPPLLVRMRPGSAGFCPPARRRLVLIPVIVPSAQH